MGQYKRFWAIVGIGTLISLGAQAAVYVPMEMPELKKCIGAWKMVGNQDWHKAFEQAKTKDCHKSADVIRWLALKNSAKLLPFQEYQKFINTHKNWPYIFIIRANAEAAVLHEINSLPPGLVTAWFKGWPARTGKGALSELIALQKLKQNVAQLAKTYWVDHTFSESEEKLFLEKFGSMLTAQDHDKRFARLIWDGHENSANRMIARLARDKRAQAKEILKYVKGEGSLAPLQRNFSAVDLYAQLCWLKKKDDLRGADYILQYNPEGLDKAHVEKWWPIRRYFAREALNLNNPELAYRVISGHQCASAVCKEEAESFAGWVALRFLHDPTKAKEHFTRMWNAVATQLSKSKAAYWLGRTYLSMGDAAKARQWFEKGQDPHSFYGQLCYARLQKTLSVHFPTWSPAAGVSAQEKRKFIEHPLLHAARLLRHTDMTNEAVGFLYQYYNILDKHPFAMQQIIEVVPAFAIRLAISDHTKYHWYYPKIQHDQKLVPAAFLHAVIHQESQFEPDSTSCAGAIGLMQLMPNTAKIVAKKHKIDYKPHLLKDPSYSIALGSLFLTQLTSEFDGMTPAIIAAYNAGGSPVRRWLKKVGAPTQDEDTLVDWIERIPYSETRGYVKRVLSNQRVYESLLG